MPSIYSIVYLVYMYFKVLVDFLNQDVINKNLSSNLFSVELFQFFFQAN